LPPDEDFDQAENVDDDQADGINPAEGAFEFSFV
jgi:hypothetical protein